MYKVYIRKVQRANVYEILWYISQPCICLIKLFLSISLCYHAKLFASYLTIAESIVLPNTVARRRTRRAVIYYTVGLDTVSTTEGHWSL